MKLSQKLSALDTILGMIAKLPADAQQWLVWRVNRMAEAAGLSLRPPAKAGKQT